MRILLDERVDWRLSRAIVGHEVKSARQMGWAAIKNGELLALAAEHFDIFVTVDQNLSSQQNVRGLPIAVISSSRSNESINRPAAFGSQPPDSDRFSESWDRHDRKRRGVTQAAMTA